jgi:central kinetochore subunit Mis15/CHL4
MSLSIPTTAALSPTTLIPSSNPSVVKSLFRLSRPSLLAIVLDWLDERNQDMTAPHLAEDDGQKREYDLHPAALSLEELREIYTDLQARKGSKREVVDRILEGDWRHGITLYQLAMLDMQYLYDHPTSQKWTALKVVRLATEHSTTTDNKTSMPRFHPSTFLQNMQKEILPDVKAHYNLDRHPTLPLWILRIYVVDSPYNSLLAFQPSSNTFDASKVFYIAFPDASPFVHVSLTTATGSAQGSISDNKSLRKLTLDGIPKAFSKPRERYKLESTSLSARNLEALCEKRGGDRTNAAGGGWGQYAEETKDNPLDIQLHRSSSDQTTDENMDESVMKRAEGMKRKREDDEVIIKRRKLVAKGRFGNSAVPNDGKGIERLDVRLEEVYPSSSTDSISVEISPGPNDATDSRKAKGRRSTISTELDRRDPEEEDDGEWRPDIRVTFQGSHIFAGIRELVEQGVVDGERMPGWMTGEEGVSIGIVREGRIKGNKGSGI